MGSNHALSNGNEPEELQEILEAFERQNQVSIAITIRLEPQLRGNALRVAAAACNNHANPVDRAKWASAHVVLPGKEYKSLAGLLTTLLYRLDFAISEKEYEATKK